MPPIPLIAHRGYQKRFPENSLLALSKAIAAGAHYIEIDIQLSADQVPVLYHDENMRRISRVEGSVKDYCWSTLTTLPAHEPDRFGELFAHNRITALTDLVAFLQTQPQVYLFTEIKNCTIDAFGIKTVFEVVSNILAPIVDRCCLMGFSVPFVTHAAANGWCDNGVIIKSWSDYSQPVIRTINPQYLFCNYRILPKKIALLDTNTRLACYEVDQPQLAKTLIARGVDLIETFAFVEMDQALNSSTS